MLYDMAANVSGQIMNLKDQQTLVDCQTLTLLSYQSEHKTGVFLLVNLDRFVKVFRYQPDHQTYQQLSSLRLMSKRLTMWKPRVFNSVLWGLLNYLLVLVGKMLYRY